MYEAEGDRVFVIQGGVREHFLTVHPTDTGGTTTVNEQAKTIAQILNEVEGRL